MVILQTMDIIKNQVYDLIGISDILRAVAIIVDRCTQYDTVANKFHEPVVSKNQKLRLLSMQGFIILFGLE